MFYKKGKRLDLFGFTDSDYVGDQDDRKSTLGCTFMMDIGVVSWSSKKQLVFTLPNTKAEFVDNNNNNNNNNNNFCTFN